MCLFFFRLYNAWKNNNIEEALLENKMLLALRESAELKQEDINVGAALLKVLQSLDVPVTDIKNELMSYAAVFSYACVVWNINKHQAAQGLLWSWCENQVSVALKTIPLGQTSGQRILSKAIDVIPQAVETGFQCDEEDIGLLAPGLAIASALHETQYSRLFRS